MPNATIELFSKAYFNKATKDAKWQYIGSPVADNFVAKTVFASTSYIQKWSEITGAWTNARSSAIEPFTGYSTTQTVDPNGITITFAGQLNGSEPAVIPLTYTSSSEEPGCNVIANSFAAPIDISRIQGSDFSDGVEATIYFFNTGSKVDLLSQMSKSIDIDAAGQYIPVPVKTAKILHDLFNYPVLIPSMQGFYVMTEKAGTLTLDYNRLVWQAEYGLSASHPLRAPSRMMAEDNENDDEVSGALQVTLYTEEGADHLVVLESPEYAAEYENGYDARKIMSGEMNIFAVEGDEKIAIDATDAIVGTNLGVRTGAESEYKLAFGHLNSEKALALMDHVTGQATDIEEGTEYKFYAAPNSEVTDRFQIVERAETPAIATGWNSIDTNKNIQKFIKDNQLYILKNGVLYTATGAVVR
jgi:hypothetical protein